MNISKTDTYWIGGGIFAAAIGGFMWWKNSQKNKDQGALVEGGGYDNLPIGNDTSGTPKGATQPYIKGGPGSMPEVLIPVRAADNERFKIGQEVEATGFYGTQTYDVKKTASGNYIGLKTKKAVFERGDKMGKIIWIGKLPNNTFRYVVQVIGIFKNDIFWVPDGSTMKPIGKLLGTVKNYDSSLNVDRILSKGIYDSKEVFELQKLLGFQTPDGDFGKDTEAALFAQKRVKSISLAKF